MAYVCGIGVKEPSVATQRMSWEDSSLAGARYAAMEAARLSILNAEEGSADVVCERVVVARLRVRLDSAVHSIILLKRERCLSFGRGGMAWRKDVVPMVVMSTGIRDIILSTDTFAECPQYLLFSSCVCLMSCTVSERRGSPMPQYE